MIDVVWGSTKKHEGAVVLSLEVKPAQASICVYLNLYIKGVCMYTKIDIHGGICDRARYSCAKLLISAIRGRRFSPGLGFRARV